MVSGLQFSVPVQIITPAFVKIVGREGPPVFLKKAAAGLIGFSVGMHADLAGEAGAFEEIAGAAGGNNVLPGCFSPFRTGDNVIESQLMCWQSIMAVLTRKIVP